MPEGCDAALLFRRDDEARSWIGCRPPVAAVMTSSMSDKQRSKRPRFWVGPLVTGACFALGYGITQRVVLMQDSWQQPQQESFGRSSFPGETLDALRLRHDADQPLMGDVAAKEASDAEQRKANEQAETIAAEAERRETANQAALLDPRPVIEDQEPAVVPVSAPVEEVVDVVQPEATATEPDLTPIPEPAMPEPDLPLPVSEPGFMTEAAPDFEPPAVVTPVPEAVITQPAVDDPQIFSAPPSAPPTP